MRLLILALAFSLASPVSAASPGPVQIPAPPSVSTANCPRTTSYQAGNVGLYRGQRLAPRKLTELPPATAYMAVYRHIGACEAPLTMVDYRNPRRR